MIQNSTISWKFNCKIELYGSSSDPTGDSAKALSELSAINNGGIDIIELQGDIGKISF